MPKKKRPEEKPDEQFGRFVETARNLGIDESGMQAEEAFRALTESRPARGQQIEDAGPKKLKSSGRRS